MSEAIGAAVYLVLALAVLVGIRAAFSKAGPGKKLERVAAHARLPRAALIENTKREQRQSHPAHHEHALPWVIPTDLAPAKNYIESKKAATTVKTISERLEIVELQLDRIAGRVSL